MAAIMFRIFNYNWLTVWENVDSLDPNILAFNRVNPINIGVTNFAFNPIGHRTFQFTAPTAGLYSFSVSNGFWPIIFRVNDASAVNRFENLFYTPGTPLLLEQGETVIIGLMGTPLNTSILPFTITITFEEGPDSTIPLVVGTETIANITGDAMYFRFQVPNPGGSYIVYAIGDTIDLYGILYYNDRDTELTRSYRAPTRPDSQPINFQLARTLEAGTYYVRVAVREGTNPTTGAFRINVREVPLPDPLPGDGRILDQWAIRNLGRMIEFEQHACCHWIEAGIVVQPMIPDPNPNNLVIDPDTGNRVPNMIIDPSDTRTWVPDPDNTFWIVDPINPDNWIPAPYIQINWILDPADPNNWMPSWDTGIVGNDINVLPVWEYTRGIFRSGPRAGQPVQIAIVDSGIQHTHPNLQNSVLPGWNFNHNNNNTFNTNEMPGRDSDIGGHGTHVGGIAAASRTSAGNGIEGVAPDAQIVPLKVLGWPLASGGAFYVGSSDILICVIAHINAYNIPIVNMSIGGYFGNSEALRIAFEGASNTLFVVSAMNQGEDLSSSSWSSDLATINANNMIVVAATDSRGELWHRSNFGGPTHIAAPGVNILSPVPTGYFAFDYAFWNGTSMAAPQVAGVAALIWSYFPDLTAAQVRNRIINNVSTRSALVGRVSSGGILNAWYAFSADDPITPVVLNNDALEYDVKERIIRIMNQMPDEHFTTRMFVNLCDSVTDRTAFIQQIVPNAEFVVYWESISTTMIEVSSIDEVRAAVISLNASENVNFAEPNYKLTFVR